MTELFFWVTLVVLLYTYVGYPLLLAAVASFHRISVIEPSYIPSVSVVVPAFNEEANIERKIRETLALEYPAEKLDLVVVSDGSTDRTETIVESLADPRVRLIKTNRRDGKTAAQNVAVPLCKGEIIVFSDATASYDRRALRYLACHYSDPSVGAVSGRYEYVDPKGASPTALGSVLFWNYENAIKRLQSRINTLTGCSGCIYSVRKTVYTALPASSCSDLVEPLLVVRKGYRVVFEDRALAFENTTTSTRDEFYMRVRVAAHGISGVLSVSELLKFWKYGWISLQIISHKLLRWLLPFLLVVLFVSSALLIERKAFWLVFLFQVAFYVLGGVAAVIPLRGRWSILNMPLYFCTVNCAVIVSVFQLCRGNRYTIWDPVRK